MGILENLEASIARCKRNLDPSKYRKIEKDLQKKQQKLSRAVLDREIPEKQIFPILRKIRELRVEIKSFLERVV